MNDPMWTPDKPWWVGWEHESMAEVYFQGRKVLTVRLSSILGDENPGKYAARLVEMLNAGKCDVQAS